MSISAVEPSAPSASPRPLLLSLRPRFAEAILDETKTVELRRTRMQAPEGTCLILYASAPMMAVVGLATLAHRDTDTPERIWRRYNRQLGLSRREYDDYLLGARFATALTVANPRRLATARTLTALRQQAKFQPPQSFRYLTREDPVSLHSLHHSWLVDVA